MIQKTENFIKKIQLGLIPTQKEYKNLMLDCMLNEDGVINIPDKYKDLYEKLSLKIEEVGEDVIRDCEATCKCKNTPIINCWVMFQSLIAAYNLNMEKQEKMFVKYITEQLKLV